MKKSVCRKYTGRHRNKKETTTFCVGSGENKDFRMTYASKREHAREKRLEDFIYLWERKTLFFRRVT